MACTFFFFFNHCFHVWLRFFLPGGNQPIESSFQASFQWPGILHFCLLQKNSKTNNKSTIPCCFFSVYTYPNRPDHLRSRHGLQPGRWRRSSSLALGPRALGLSWGELNNGFPFGLHVNQPQKRTLNKHTPCFCPTALGSLAG